MDRDDPLICSIMGVEDADGIEEFDLEPTEAGWSATREAAVELSDGTTVGCTVTVTVSLK